MTTEIKETLKAVHELEENGFTRDQAIQLLQATAMRSVASLLDDISETIDRLSDNLTNSIDALEEAATTGKISIKGRIDNYNLN